MSATEADSPNPESPRAARRHPRVGFLVHGNTIWFSELLATAIAGLLLILLMSITLYLVLEGHQARRVEQRIAALKSEQIAVADTLDRLQKQIRILTLLRRASITRGVSDATLCKVAALVSSNSEKFGYDPLLLLAVIHVESIFDPAARGRFMSGTLSGAIGLMQLQPETALDVAQQLDMPPLKRKDLLKPDVNLVLGVAYLTQLITQFKSFKLGLLAYNQGPGVVYQTLSNGEPLTLDYYRLVLRSYFELKKMARTIDGEGAQAER